MSAVVYLTLGSLLSEMIALRRLKFYLLALALFLAGLVGASRVYLGVHYPSDVLAGWAAGLVWAVFCWLLARTLRRHAVTETRPPLPPRHAVPLFPSGADGVLPLEGPPQTASKAGSFL